MVDSLGYLLAVVVTGAQVQDSQTAAVAPLFIRLRQMLQRAHKRLGFWPKLDQVFADGGYRGTAGLWAKQMGFALQQIRRSGPGFQKLPKRWVVERSFAWLFNYRRLLFDLEFKPTHSEGMIYMANILHMLHRIWPNAAS